jgi:hypothetical protein
VFDNQWYATKDDIIIKITGFVVMMNEIDDITEKENRFASTINLDDLD